MTRVPRVSIARPGLNGAVCSQCPTVKQFKICRGEVLSATDLQVPMRPTRAGTGDGMGSRNIIIPKTPAREKQNPSNEIESLHGTINQLQNQMKYLQPGDGSFNSTDFRWRLNKIEKEKLELTSKFNEERSAFESHVARLRAQLEKGEAMRQTLEYDLAVSKKEASVVRTTSEDRIESIHKIHAQLKVQNSELQQKVENLERTSQILQQAREDDQQRFQSEQEDHEKIIQNSNTENEFLIAERNRINTILQDQEQTFVELQKRLKELEVERNSLTEALRRQAKEFEYSIDREERLKKELEMGKQRVKLLEENIEAERAAHLESKFNSEIIQLRIRDLENALEVEKSSHANAVSTLEMIKQQLRDVEFSYERERTKVVESTDQLQKLQKEYTATKTQLTIELEEKNDAIADLSKRLQRHEESFENLCDEVTKAKKRHAFLEETYGGSMRELELLLANFAVSGSRSSVNLRDKDKLLNPSVVLENLRQTMTDYQSRLEDTSNELNRVKDLYDKINEQCEAYKELIWSRNENREKIQEELAVTNKKLNHWRSECAEKDALIDAMSMDLQNVKHCFEREKNSNVEAKNEIQKLTRAHQVDVEEKLTFLHGLYQRLTAGCVVMKQPDSMMSKFSWPELCSILQENVDAFISDLNKANEKESYLEHICRNKEETIQQLQQSQETTFNKLTEQMKEREATWQKQKNEMEQHYSELLGEVHSRAQSCHLGAEEAKEKVSSLGKVNDQLTLELSFTKKLLSQKQKEHVALLAACALMAGAIYPLYNRSCELSVQKDFLKEQINACEYFKNEIRTVVQVLSLEGNPSKSKKRKKPPRGLIQIFRKSVIAIIAANRLRAFGLGCRPLFTWSEGIKNKPRLAVCSGNTKSSFTGSRQEQEQNQFTKAVGWFSSSDLLAAIVETMSELQDVIMKAHPNHLLSNWSMENAAKSSFSKFMDRLSVEMENVSVWCDKHTGCGRKKSLVQILGCGLYKVNARAGKEGCQVTMPIKQCVEVLKKQILEFTQRLHAAEIERRSLRLELTQLKNYVSDLKRETGKAQILQQQLTDLKQSLKTQKMVPFERFGSICEELNNALQREQQAQLLLNEQAHQMQELNLRLEQHSNKEAEKNQTLSDAVMSLSEAKMELRRKDQSLRQLNKNQAQLEQDKRQLEESIQDAENALCKAAKDREHLISYLRGLDVGFQQVRDQISLSWSVTARNDFTLQLPKLQLETLVAKGPKDGLEVTSLQNLTQTFTDIYQLASSRVTALEAEIASHQKHIGALKSELQTACLRENNALVPLIRTQMNQPFASHSDMLLPQEKNISQDFAPLQAEMDTSYSILRERSGNSRPQSHSSTYSLHVSSTTGSTRPVQNGFYSTLR
ncbi:coiled-coil domain-containing protein 171-like isoform X2 [Leucoraja erinacea]|uniref:coiled-coil domain-containing protein 171-like isoform X2 n=1 Tax=Leucoraja erinaceus TaxID=7782 RepID=UPI0024543BC9|nr:coiled-coil domain-containing protein 171-like isoform X2 [Leucoraja erinacea]